MKCNVCDEKVDRCDECNRKFHKGDGLFCSVDGFEAHVCIDCYAPADEGEVE